VAATWQVEQPRCYHFPVTCQGRHRHREMEGGSYRKCSQRRPVNPWLPCLRGRPEVDFLATALQYNDDFGRKTPHRWREMHSFLSVAQARKSFSPTHAPTFHS